MSGPGAPERLLPLTQAVYQVLLALADRERHGYGIMQDIRERTRGRVEMGSGTLYGTIKRMLRDGLIETSSYRQDPEIEDQRRRYYRLTPFGRQGARSEAKRLQALVADARSRMLLDEGR